MAERECPVLGVPELSSSEARLLPLLTTPLSLGEIARLLDLPHDDVLAQARTVYAKLGLSDR